MARPRRIHHPVPVATILKSILARRQPAAFDQLGEATRAVERGLADDYAGRMRIVSVGSSTAVLEVDHSALLQELRSFHQQAILRALNAVEGLERVTTIRYRVGGSSNAHR